MSDSLPRLPAALSNRYRVERELGQGGKGVVILAPTGGAAQVVVALHWAQTLRGR